jgi:tripartite-type tricarboxylate transporter receptor subunit TctC
MKPLLRGVTLPSIISSVKFSAGVTALVLVMSAVGAAAQPYPTKPIRIISPFSAGSPPDALGRFVGQKLTERLGQAIIIENRPGAGTTLATKAGATAEPDGYTLLQVASTLAFASVLFPNPGYDPIKSFSPVAGLASWSLLLFVAPDIPATSVQALIGHAKANPGQVTIGVPLGSESHVLAETFKSLTGAPFNIIPYRQFSQLTADLMAGRIHALFNTSPALVSLVQEGKLKALAYTGATRSPALPQVPTVTEIGLPQLASIRVWLGIVAPAGTPPEAIKTLNTAINEILASSEAQATFAKLGWEPNIGSPQEFATFLVSEMEKWPSLAKEAGLKPD